MNSVLVLLIAIIQALPTESQTPAEICDKHKQVQDHAFLIRGICFVVSNDKKSYNEAKVSCNESPDGHLAHIVWWQVYTGLVSAISSTLNDDVDMYIGKEYEKDGHDLGSWVRYEDNDMEKRVAENIEKYQFAPPGQSGPEYKSLTKPDVERVGIFFGLQEVNVNDQQKLRKYLCQYGEDGEYAKQRQFMNQCRNNLNGLYTSVPRETTCIVKSKDKLSYDQAKFACNDLKNGHLAHVESIDHIALLSKYGIIDKKPSAAIEPFGSFIGVEQESINETKEQWTYVKYDSDKQRIIVGPFKEKIWSDKKSNDQEEMIRRVATVSDQGFKDEDATAVLHYLCQYNFFEELST